MMWIFIVGFSQQTAQNLIDISINCLVFAFVRFLNVVKERKKLPTHDEINKKKQQRRNYFFLLFSVTFACSTQTHMRAEQRVSTLHDHHQHHFAKSIESIEKAISYVECRINCTKINFSHFATHEQK